MSGKSFIISLLIVSVTIIGGTCLFGFCASADSGIPVDLEVVDITNDSNKDLPVAEGVIKEDGKLNGQILSVKETDVNFGENFDLQKNQQKIIQAEQRAKIRSHKKLASVKKPKDKVLLKNTKRNLSVEMDSVLAEIKKQEQEVRNLLSELKSIKNNQAKPSDDTEKSADKEMTIAKPNEKGNTDTNNDMAKLQGVTEKDKVIDKNGGNVVKTVERTDTKPQTLTDVQFVSAKKKAAHITDKKKKFSPMIVESGQKDNGKYDFAFKDYSKDNSGRVSTDADIDSGSFEKAFSALRPEKSKKQNNVLSDRRKKGEIIEKASGESVKRFHNAYADIDYVKKDFYKTYISENKYLRPFETDDDKNDTHKDDNKRAHDILQLKIEFQENSAALSAVDVNILRYFVYIAQNDPTKGVQISISQDNMKDVNKKKLAARRLAIVSAIFKEEGLTDRQIIPVLTDRDTDSFIFSIVSVDKMENYQKNEGTKDMFGDTVGASQTFRTMKW